MKTQNKKISLITVGMNHLPYLQKLYFSLYNDSTTKPKVDFEAVFVDNCSRDGSVEFLEKEYPEVIIIKNQNIQGFGANNNLGVRHSSGEYVAIINPDIILMPESIDRLYDYLQRHPGIGLVAPKLLNPDRSLQYSARRFITIKILIWRLFTLGNNRSVNSAMTYYLNKNLDLNEINAVDWVTGAAFLITKSCFDEMGGFDEDYFLYFEDEDLCLRLWQKGRKIIYLPEAKMIHNHMRESRSFNTKLFMHMKSMMLFYIKHRFFFRRKQIVKYINREIEL